MGRSFWIRVCLYGVCECQDRRPWGRQEFKTIHALFPRTFDGSVKYCLTGLLVGHDLDLPSRCLATFLGKPKTTQLAEVRVTLVPLRQVCVGQPGTHHSWCMFVSTRCSSTVDFILLPHPINCFTN